jgi:galactonate dehydratase
MGAIMSLSTIHRRARLQTGIALQAAAPAAPSALDIAEIRHFPLREPTSGKTWSVLRVKSRSGLTGWGECQFDPAADFKALQSAWVGRAANTFATITPATPFAAALDMALLDIMGKAANAPVYRVLGGPTRHKVRAYSAAATKDFPVVVIDAPAPEWRNQGQAYQNRVLELVKAVPEDQDFVIAGKGNLTPGDAASVAKSIEKKFPLWFDEPCAHGNIEALRKVSGETVVPLGFGEGIKDPVVFQTLLRESLIDVVRPDIAIFGISGSRRIAALAEPYYVAVAPRHDGGPIATAAAIHLAASIPNFFIQHLPIPSDEKDRAMRREIVSPAVETTAAGFLSVTKTPGLGITVSEAALEKYHAS